MSDQSIDPGVGSTEIKRERLVTLDVLRGGALLGILLVNFSFFAMPDGSFGSYINLEFPSWYDQTAIFLINTFCDGKFILIFSFLFGWGADLQFKGGQNRAGTYRYHRRLLGLLCIGILHVTLLFIGDILVSYAILGVPLFWARKWKPSSLAYLASLFWFFSVVGHWLLTWLPLPNVSTLDAYQEILRVYSKGEFREIVAARLQALVGLYFVTPILFMPQVMGMFLLGLAASKRYNDVGLSGFLPLAKTLLTVLWLPALLGNFAYASLDVLANQRMDPIFGMLSLICRALFAPMLTLIYLSIATLLLSSERGLRRWIWLAGEGRSTLSLYIGESIIMGWIFNSYGLGLYGQIGPALGILICLGVYAILLGAMKLWLTYFRLGPLEWLLRCFTDWKLVAIRT